MISLRCAPFLHHIVLFLISFFIFLFQSHIIDKCTNLYNARKFLLAPEKVIRLLIKQEKGLSHGV